ncbi:sensor histidine kinase, partial [Streptomyces sp. NPDC056937]
MRRARPHRGMSSLRAKLTWVNVALLALGVIVATGVSVMGMRHYLLDNVDSELTQSRSSLLATGITMKDIERLSELGIALDKLSPGGKEHASALPRGDTVFVAVDKGGKPVAIGSLVPTPRQRALAAAVDDPGAVADSAEPRDVTLDGDAHRMVGAE